MASNIYSKPALTYHEQLQLLSSRGLGYDNKERALHLLEVLSYYRLSAYLYPLLEGNKEEHKFKEGAKIEQAFEMYYFDRELRLLLLSDIEKIEVALRAKLTYVLSHKYDAYWYTYSGLFSDRNKHLATLSIISNDVGKSNEVFVKNYQVKYINSHLPSWMALELVTFTCLSKIFENLKDTAAKAEIAGFFGVPYQLFENWLHVISYTRNTCAHHARFWNREFSISALKPTKTLSHSWIDDFGLSKKKAYLYICIIKYLLDRVNPNNTLTTKLKALYSKHPNINAFALDFPDNWVEQPLWMEKLKV